MRTNEPTWTDERIELLKSRFAAGLTSREIAGELGLSRNAVIGKLSRLNLKRDNGDDGRRTSQQDAANGRRPRSVPRLQYQLLQNVYDEPPPAADDAPIDRGQHCSLLELSEARCRWPISSPGEKDFCFCGNRPLEGLPYCAGHSRLAYRPGSRQRVARG